VWGQAAMKKKGELRLFSLSDKLHYSIGHQVDDRLRLKIIDALWNKGGIWDTLRSNLEFRVREHLRDERA
jgi:hypothetical protein